MTDMNIPDEELKVARDAYGRATGPIGWALGPLDNRALADALMSRYHLIPREV